MNNLEDQDTDWKIYSGEQDRARQGSEHQVSVDEQRISAGNLVQKVVFAEQAEFNVEEKLSFFFL